MLIISLEERLRELGTDHLSRWSEACKIARDLEDRGYLFHGTSSQAASAIMEEGFTGLRQDRPFFVYWGRLNYALNFADRGWRYPALLAAPLEDILASGRPLPMTSQDRQMEDAPEFSTWQESFAESGCIRVEGGSRVKSLQMLSHL